MISIPDNADFDFIKAHIKKFELDDRVLKKEEFLVLKKENELFAFGRIRKHKGCDEICSIGVVEKDRRKGYATLLVKELIKTATQPLYLVCIIPEFFTPLGFKVVIHYPAALADKLNYCTNELVVPEKYVVMQYYK